MLYDILYTSYNNILMVQTKYVNWKHRCDLTYKYVGGTNCSDFLPWTLLVAFKTVKSAYHCFWKSRRLRFAVVSFYPRFCPMTTFLLVFIATSMLSPRNIF